MAQARIHFKFHEETGGVLIFADVLEGRQVPWLHQACRVDVGSLPCRIDSRPFGKWPVPHAGELFHLCVGQGPGSQPLQTVLLRISVHSTVIN